MLIDIEVLDDCLLPSNNIFKEENNGTKFQQNGALCHTAKISNNKLNSKNYLTMPLRKSSKLNAKESKSMLTSETWFYKVLKCFFLWFSFR